MFGFRSLERIYLFLIPLSFTYLYTVYIYNILQYSYNLRKYVTNIYTTVST